MSRLDLELRNENSISGLLKMALDDVKFLKKGRLRSKNTFTKINVRFDHKVWVRTWVNESVQPREIECKVSMAGAVMLRRLVHPQDVGVQSFYPREFQSIRDYGFKVTSHIQSIENMSRGYFESAMCQVGFKIKEIFHLRDDLEKIQRKVTMEVKEEFHNQLEEWKEILKQLKALGV